MASENRQRSSKMTDRQKIELAVIAYQVVHGGYIGWLYKEIYRRALVKFEGTVDEDELFDAVLRHTSCA